MSKSLTDEGIEKLIEDFNCFIWRISHDESNISWERSEELARQFIRRIEWNDENEFGIKDVEEKESFSYQELLDSWKSLIVKYQKSSSLYNRGISNGMHICWSELQTYIDKIRDAENESDACPICGEKIEIIIGDECGSEPNGSVQISHYCDSGIDFIYFEKGKDIEKAKKMLHKLTHFNKRKSYVTDEEGEQTTG